MYMALLCPNAIADVKIDQEECVMSYCEELLARARGGSWKAKSMATSIYCMDRISGSCPYFVLKRAVLKKIS